MIPAPKMGDGHGIYVSESMIETALLELGLDKGDMMGRLFFDPPRSAGAGSFCFQQSNALVPTLSLPSTSSNREKLFYQPPTSLG